MIEHKIIDYLTQHSRGIIKITMKEARDIVEMVKGSRVQDGSYVKLSRKNAATGNWDWERNISATIENINKQIRIALDEKPAMDSYKYECFSAPDVKDGDIYCTNPNLFD